MDGPWHAIFSYGTLRLEHVQRALFGRVLDGSDDSLSGWAIVEVVIEDPDVLGASGIETHPGLVPDPAAPPIAGTRFLLTAEELAAADRYESAAYTRVAVTLASGLPAFVYVKA